MIHRDEFPSSSDNGSSSNESNNQSVNNDSLNSGDEDVSESSYSTQETLPQVTNNTKNKQFLGPIPLPPPLVQNNSFRQSPSVINTNFTTSAPIPPPPPIPSYLQNEIQQNNNNTSPLQTRQASNYLKTQNNATKYSPLPPPSPHNVSKSCPTIIKPSSLMMNQSPLSSTTTKNSCKSVTEAITEQRPLVEQQQQMPSFKLDHLSDINPKRLNENTKFRCRIHDVIDPSGCFGVEVIYSEEDEAKFKQMFKLFRLCSAINQVPRKIQRRQRVSAYYKNDWHRAIILSDQLKLNKTNQTCTVEVKFIDLGVKREVLRYEHVKEIDEKFFNFPSKSALCTVNLDDELRLLDPKLKEILKPLHLKLDAQKFFTRSIYDKVLFAKVLSNKSQEPIKIKLCLSTSKGIFLFL